MAVGTRSYCVVPSNHWFSHRLVLDSADPERAIHALSRRNADHPIAQVWRLAADQVGSSPGSEHARVGQRVGHSTSPTTTHGRWIEPPHRRGQGVGPRARPREGCGLRVPPPRHVPMAAAGGRRPERGRFGGRSAGSHRSPAHDSHRRAARQPRDSRSLPDSGQALAPVQRSGTRGRLDWTKWRRVTAPTATVAWMRQ